MRVPRRLSRLRANATPASVEWLKHGGWIGGQVTGAFPAAPRKSLIEAAAMQTDQLGEQPLAPEYGERHGKRSPRVVRSAPWAGDLYAWLVVARQPKIVVEIGAAFGVSGMYWGVGLSGWLYSYEINDAWADVAERNIALVTDRFTLTRGPFEDHVDRLPGPIDIAFVDGIHRADIVLRQWDILRSRISDGGLILFDDISFAKPGCGMRDAWLEIAAHSDVVAAAEIRGRLGIVEVTRRIDDAQG